MEQKIGQKRGKRANSGLGEEQLAALMTESGKAAEMGKKGEERNPLRPSRPSATKSTSPEARKWASKLD